MTAQAFELYTLKVEVVDTGRPFVCSHQVGDYFIVEGENLIFEHTHAFSLYALAALLPLLPAKQRPLQHADWMLSDSIIACPDPHCGAAFKITRIGTHTFQHDEVTAVPITVNTENTDNTQNKDTAQ
ncbi:TIGR04076 family protein [Alloscardovia criceti]|uniref:TIGR04076 family protein n=1 Tax=Alloscardovia criceti TaxID=356828 RepID=UPI0003606098|nr:TIGR04076 family protein [Alloscardovia criceti]